MQSVKIFLLSLSLWLLGTTASAEYHHVDDCTTCHWWVDPDGTMVGDNLYAIRKLIQTPNSGFKDVNFTATSGMGSYADTDDVFNGVCQVCHTKNNHHLNDGSARYKDLHMEGERCTKCHLHVNQFAPPVQQAHRTHLEDAKGPTIYECTVCHTPPVLSDPNFQHANDVNYSITFTDGQPLATTTVCDNCHSPNGSFPGVNGLMDPVIGAKANFRSGIYESDRITLKPGKEKWCATCHDESPSYAVHNPVAPIDPIYINWGAAQYYQNTPATPGWWSTRWDNTQKYANGNSAGHIAEFNFNIVQDATYEIWSRWGNYASNDPDGPYLVPYQFDQSGIITTMYVDQNRTALEYVKLGEVTLTAGPVILKLYGATSQTIFSGDLKIVSANSKPPATARAVIGDNDTYGFYVSGHKIVCTECHDTRKTHIDYDIRSHEINASNLEVIKTWGDGYRLQSEDPTSGESLCVRCHDFRMIWDDMAPTDGYTQSRYFQTNYRSNNNGYNNMHSTHLGFPFNLANGGDSDLDGTVDSMMRCTNCHNVHGSTKAHMFRDGILEKTLERPDTFPMHDLDYKIYAKAQWNPTLLGGDYNVSVYWPAGVGTATTAPFTVKSAAPFTTTTKLNQAAGGNAWVDIGSYNFRPGSSGLVYLNINGSGGTVVADAVKFKSAAEEIIIDNSNLDGNYTTYGGVVTGVAGGNGGTCDTIAVGAVQGQEKNPMLAETFQTYIPGTMTDAIASNKMCKSCHAGDKTAGTRTPVNAPKILNRFEDKRWVLDDGTEDAEVYITAHDLDSNISWVTLDLGPLGGTMVNMVWVEGQTYKYTIPGSMIAGKSDLGYVLPVIAEDTDGHRVTHETYIFPKESKDTIYLDTNWVELYNVNWWVMLVDNIWNSDQSYIPYNGLAGAWRAHYGPGYRKTRESAYYSQSYGIWKPRIPTNGKYEVRGMWNEEGGLVNYTAYAADGIKTLYGVNQAANPGAWNLIGTYSFLEGEVNYIRQDSNNSTAMVADAMKFTRVNAEPLVRLSGSQRIDGTFKKSRYFAGSEMATITAIAHDYDEWDKFDQVLNPQPLTYNWNATDPEIMAFANQEGYYGEQLSFVPLGIKPGVYTIRCSVTDTGVPANPNPAFNPKTTTVEFKIRIMESIPQLGTGDSDFDTIPDNLDGWWDSDEDGIPNYLDGSLKANQIQDAGTLALETEPDLFLRIGETAFYQPDPSKPLDSVLSYAELIAYAEATAGQLENGAGGILNGVFDFEIIGLEMVGESAKVVLPLQWGQTVPANGLKYKKYDAQASPQWRDFVENANNSVKSALKVGGICPLPGSSTYRAVTAGDECIELTIQDGGPNDADGLANGEIKDPGAFFNEGNGGSGSVTVWMLLGLGTVSLFGIFARRRAAG